MLVSFRYRFRLRKMRKIPTYKELHIMKIRERLTYNTMLKYPARYEKSLTIVKSFITRSVGTICVTQQMQKCIKMLI